MCLTPMGGAGARKTCSPGVDHDDDHYHDHYHSKAECVARCPNKAKPAAEVCTLPLVSGQVVVGDLYDGDDGGDDDDDDVP